MVANERGVWGVVPRGSTERWVVPLGTADAALIFVGEMYGIQLDQLAAVLDATPRRTASQVARWRAAGVMDAGVLSAGPRWVWLTRAGLQACGLSYRAGTPGLSRLAHLRAVAAARLAFAATPQVTAAGAYWRSERRIRLKVGGRIGLREHVPDAELVWPDGAELHGRTLPWAGECWAIEAELTPKTAARTVAIMRELLGRTGDYGCVAGDVQVPGRPARHARAIYLCTPAALPVVSRARDSLGVLGARIEIRLLPAAAELGGHGPPSGRQQAPARLPAAPSLAAQPLPPRGSPAQSLQARSIQARAPGPP